ncbi:MAG: TonB-dependent siderophore receptor [Psychrobacter sp.]|uniref:TonB-dependent siderophore receptor n=1 Tax=unclassified Psychrobacter TaxID=196806 RepID=UPI0017882D50|nr:MULTISPECIES: TonB-dependent siderophore receptor [unclassified Psychrobacter]MBE0443317.1 TonB-dependent siderophore receptor [Psychrobacter sp. FME13]
MRLQLASESIRKKHLTVAVQIGLIMSISQLAYAETTYTEDSLSTSETENAETAIPSTTLDAITVYADSYRSTGTKTALDPEDAPMSYTRIDQDLLQKRQADSVSAALRYEPGVSSESRGTVTIFDENRVRGFKTLSNFYDGLRLPYDGAWNLMPQVDVYATEAVEVVKGSASSLYGYTAPGGMVNQIAKTPQSTQETEVQLRLGNQDLKEVGIDTTGALTDSLNYRFVALKRKKDGQMQTTEEERTLINPSLEWQATDDVSVLANLFYQDDPNMVPSTPLPSVGTVYNASYGKLDSDAYAGDEWNKFSKEVFMPSVTVNWDINDQLTFKHILRYTDSEAEQRNMYNSGGYVSGSDTILNRVAYTTDESMKNWTTDNQLAYQFDTANTSHNLLFGVEYQETDSTADYYDAGADGTPNLDLSNPDFSQINANTLPLDVYSQYEDIEQSQLGFYVQDEMTWKDWTVVAGLRHDKFKSLTDQTKASQGVIYSVQEIDNDASETSGRLAAIYNFDNGISPFVSYSQSFQPVVGSNFVTNEPFEPTTADQLEAGIKYQSSDGGTKGTLAVFDINQQNVVVSDYINYRNQTQTGEIASKGFEVSGSHMLNDWVDVAASYSYTDAEITEEEINPEVVGNTPAQTAKHKATLWADYYATDKLTLNAGVRYESGMQIDRQNTDELPSVTLVDVGGSYEVNPTFTVGASVNNLFDKTYVSSCYDTNNCWMGPERQMVVSVKANF